MNFTNKVAIVTGAGGGLGLAIIEKFARGGAAIVALDYSQKWQMPLPKKFARSLNKKC